MMQVNTNETKTYDILGLTQREYEVIVALVGHIAALDPDGVMYMDLASPLGYDHPAVVAHNGDRMLPLYISKEN